MIFRFLYPALLLLFCSALLFPDQITAQTSDPSLRLPGDAVDSITGGPPTVMIRSMTKKDYAYPRIHAITFDPILALFYLNVGYEQGLNNYFTLGGRLQVPKGILTSDETEDIWSVGADTRLYVNGEGAKDFFARLYPRLYIGSRTIRQWDEDVDDYVTRDVDIFTPSVQMELGWRVIWFNRVAVDWTIGAEKMFGDPEKLGDATFLWIGNDPVTITGSLRLGWTW